MPSFRIGLVCSLAIVALSCAQDVNDLRKIRGSEADVLAKECNSLKITNGRDSKDPRLNGVIEISIQGLRGRSACTGTFIRPDTIITAAHCFDDLNPSRINIKLEDRTIRATHHKVNPLYSTKPTLRFSKVNNDLALIYLSTEQKVNTIPICNFTPKEATDAIIVGFGFTSNLENKGSGKKKEGFTKIAKIDPLGPITSFGQAETTSGDGSNASTASGDSGGPLLVEDENQELCLLATTQSGKVIDKYDEATYTNLRYKDAKKFLVDNGISYNEERASTGESAGKKESLLKDAEGKTSNIICN